MRSDGLRSTKRPSLLLAYLMRHGSTAMSPQPEGWKQNSLDRIGMQQAVSGADFLEQWVRDHPRPCWGISSDLARSEETLAIANAILGGLEIVPPLRDLRAYEFSQETPAQYELRSERAFHEVFKMANDKGNIPLIVAHRSTTAFLEKTTPLLKGESWKPDYRNYSLLLEGGVLGITDRGLVPLFLAIADNWTARA